MAILAEVAKYMRSNALRLMAVWVQSFMLAQVTFFYLKFLWTVRRRGPRQQLVEEALSTDFGSCLLSIIVMVRNEADSISKMLQALDTAAKAPKQLEVVLVDSGCTDDTLERAKREESNLRYQLRFVASGGEGRGLALDAGTAAAKGEIIFVVHADCVVPEGFDAAIRQGLAKPGVLATAFRFALNRAELSAPLPGAGVMEFTVNVRARLLQLPFGDQGLALAASRLRLYDGWGGREYPLMEDFRVVQRLREDGAAGRGRIEVLAPALLCSPRRWAKLGVWRVNLVNQAVMLWYRCGATPQQLFDFYYGKKTDHVPRLLHLLTAPLMRH